MRRQKTTSVCGVIAPPSRPTVYAAALVATALSIPVALLGVLVERFF